MQKTNTKAKYILQAILVLFQCLLKELKARTNLTFSNFDFEVQIQQFQPKSEIKFAFLIF